MALVLLDRCQQTASANTTVSFTLTGTVAGFQSFSGVGNGNATYYSAFDASGNWEVGLGTYSTTGPTLTRTTILSSSNSGSAVTFSGTVNVFVTYPSEKSVNLDASGNATALGTPTAFTATNVTGLPLTTGVTGTLPIANGGTNATTASAALTSLGAYPASNPSGYTNNTGTVTSVNLTAGTGVSVSGGPVTGSGSITVNNTGVTSVAAGTGISVSGSTGGVTISATSTGLPGVLGQVFTASGTFTIPTGVTAIKATVVGGGGSGSISTGGGSGGGAGATAIKYFTGLTPGNTLSVTVGAGASGTFQNGDGTSGGSTTVASGTQTITTVTGGGGGGAVSYSGGSTGHGGFGGTATNGSLNLTGGGGNMYDPSDGFSAAGGSSSLGGGGAGVNSPANPGGTNTGGGGGGNNGGPGTGQSSGAGGSGVVIFEW